MRLPIILLLSALIMLSSCASGYKMINPSTLAYNSTDIKEGIQLEYQYDVLSKKYSKKEVKRGVKVVAVKITNNTESDIVFGEDFKLVYDNGNELSIMEKQFTFTSLKQSSASYLWYLLLTPINISIFEDGEPTTNIPFGLVAGPLIAGGNMLAAGSANKKFKSELLEFDILGATIKPGETKTGLIGISSNHYNAIKLRVE